MRTLTVDILDDKAFKLLKGLEELHVIKVHETLENGQAPAINSFTKYKGKISRQSIEEIDRQLNDMRNEWE
jgi:hypothetical protein